MNESFVSIMNTYLNNIDKYAVDMRFPTDNEDLENSYEELSHFLECARNHVDKYGKDEAYTIACDIVAFCDDVDPYGFDMEQVVLYEMDGTADEIKSGDVKWLEEIIVEECEGDIGLCTRGWKLVERIKKLREEV